jgi:hypothetical protein
MEIEGCLERYPEYAEELRPLLMLAVDVRHVTIPVVPATARAAGKRRMLAAHAKRAKSADQTHPVLRHAKRLGWALMPGRPGSLRPAWPAVAAVLFALLAVTSGVTVASSAGSLPGDALYPVKLASQRLQLALTLNPVAHGLLVDRYDAQRRLDVQAVLKGGRRATFDFRGTLQRMEEGIWVIGDLPVTLRETTAIVGVPYLGAVVRVGGELPGDGRLVAHWVRIESEMRNLPTATPEATYAPPPDATPTRTETPAPTSTAVPAQTLEDAEMQAPDDTLELTGPPQTSTPEPEDTPSSTTTPERPKLQDDDGHTPEPSDNAGPGEARQPGEAPEEDEGPEEGRAPGDNGEPGEDEEPQEEETPVEGGEPGEDEEPEEEETPEDDDGPEDGGTPEPDSTPDD